MGIVNTICCVLIIALAVVGGIAIILVVNSIIDEHIKKKDNERSKKNKLRCVSQYCDTHIVPIWAEEKAIDQIKHDYPLDRVLRILRSHEIDPKEVTTKLKQVGTVVDSKEEE